MNDPPHTMIDSPLNPLEQRICDIIATGLKIDKERIVPKARLLDDLGADSLDSSEIVMALEEEFNIDIPEDDAEKFLTVENIFEYIKTKAAA
jgi:acyl carrier protein